MLPVLPAEQSSDVTLSDEFDQEEVGLSQKSNVSAVQPFLDKLNELQGPAEPQEVPEVETSRCFRRTKKRKRALENWGSLSQDDTEAHKFIAACVCYDTAPYLRSFMIKKRTRKYLKKVHEQARAKRS